MLASSSPAVAQHALRSLRDEGLPPDSSDTDLAARMLNRGARPEDPLWKAVRGQHDLRRHEALTGQPF